MAVDEEKILESKVMRIKPIRSDNLSDIDEGILDALRRAVGEDCPDFSVENASLEESPRLGGYSYLVVFTCNDRLYGAEFAIEVNYEATPYEFGRLPSDEDEG